MVKEKKMEEKSKIKFGIKSKKFKIPQKYKKLKKKLKFRKS